MTLNSTGLAIGSALPSANLLVSGNALVTHSLAVGGSSLSSSNLNVNGSMGMSVGTISTNTLIPEHSFILANTATGNLTVYLPSANICAGRLVTIKKASTSYDLTIMPMLKNTIDGNVSLGLKSLSDTLPYASLMSSGSNWHILGVTSSAVKTVLPGFISTWKTDNAGTSASDQIRLPLGGTQNFTVFWGDGSSNVISGAINSGNTHTYSSAGVYQVRIVGIVSGWKFQSGGDCLKLLDISQWDGFKFTSQALSMFQGCTNLTISATDFPDISAIGPGFNQTFAQCSSLTSAPFMAFWNLSGITTMNQMFLGCTNFNQDLSSWDVSSVTSFYRAFSGCSAFKQDISAWNPASLIPGPFGSNGTDFFANVDINNPNSTTSTANYDALLVSWAGKTLQSGLSINFGTSKYSAAGNVGRVILTGTKGWTITDGGFKP